MVFFLWIFIVGVDFRLIFFIFILFNVLNGLVYIGFLVDDRVVEVDEVLLLIGRGEGFVFIFGFV